MKELIFYFISNYGVEILSMAFRSALSNILKKTLPGYAMLCFFVWLTSDAQLIKIQIMFCNLMSLVKININAFCFNFRKSYMINHESFHLNWFFHPNTNWYSLILGIRIFSFSWSMISYKLILQKYAKQVKSYSDV